MQPDYRGYLQTQSQAGYGAATQLLGAVGNDLQLDPRKTNPSLQSANDWYTQQYLKQAGGGQQSSPTINIPGPYIPPQPATINVGGILSAAKQGATNQVNPLYNQYLNQYLQNEAAGKAAQQAETETAIKNQQAQLANQLQGTGLERTATQQNTELGLANIGAQEQNFQAQSGLAFNQQREQQLEQAGQSGLAGSGIAGGADQVAQQARGLKEAGQEQGYTYSANQKKLLESQTFDQLANTDAMSKLKETEGENTANFNLADYLRQASNSEFQFQKQNELDRQTAIQQATANIYKTNFLNALKPYAGTATYAPTYQAYGGGGI